MIEGLRSLCRGRWKKAFECSGVFVLAFLLCGVGFYGSIAPVGVCFQGCFAGRRRMFFAFLGVILGSCVFGYAPIKYIAVSLILTVMNEAFMNLSDIRHGLYALFGVTGAVGLIGLIGLISPSGEMAGLLYVAELVVCAMLSALFYGAAGGKSLIEEKGGKSVSRWLILALALGIIPPLWGFSVGRLLLCGTVLIAALRHGIFGGVIVGLVGGLGFDLSSQAVPLWGCALGLGGLVAGAATGRKRFVRVLLFVLLGASVRLLAVTGGGFLTGLLELTLGTLSVMFIPEHFFESGGTGSAGSLSQDPFSKHIKLSVAKRLLGVSDAYSAMADSFSGEEAEENVKQPGLSIYEGACSGLCSSCESKKLCWEERALNTKMALENALEHILARGNAEPEDFGDEFSCDRVAAFCAAATLGLREKRREMLLSGARRDEDMRTVRQYHGISDVIDESVEDIINARLYDRQESGAVKKLLYDMGVEGDAVVYRDGRGVLHCEISGRDLTLLRNSPERLRDELEELFDLPLELPEEEDGKNYSLMSLKASAQRDFAIGASAEKRAGEAVSGDCATYFRESDGSLLVILCDGMGSGSEAHSRAREVMALCESFLRVGVAPLNVVEIVAANLEQQDRGAGSVTVDIARIDPYTSMLTSVKYGAAPTLIRHRTADGRYSLSKICAGGGGGELYAVAEAETELSDGDTVLIASDGADWSNRLEKALVGVMTDDPSDLCDILMHMLPRDAADDRTLIAVNFYSKDNSREMRKPKRMAVS